MEHLEKAPFVSKEGENIVLKCKAFTASYEQGKFCTLTVNGEVIEYGLRIHLRDIKVGSVTIFAEFENADREIISTSPEISRGDFGDMELDFVVPKKAAGWVNVHVSYMSDDYKRETFVFYANEAQRHIIIHQ